MKKILFLIVFLNFCLFGAPAFSVIKEFKQANGEVFYGIAKGNEFLNYIETLNGDILKYNPKTKNFEYAKILNDKLVPSGVKYPNENVKKISKKDLEALINR
jgi:hypothetical protein